MVEANDIWPFQEHSARQLPNLSFMNASLEHAQQDFLSAHMNPGTCMLSKNTPLAGIKAPALSNFELQEANGALGFRSLPPVYLPNFLPTPHLNTEAKSPVALCGLGGKPDSNMISGSFGKKYLIFDQCGNDTRMVYRYRSVCSETVYPSTAVVSNVYGCELDKELPTTKFDGYVLGKPNLHEECDENHVSEGSDMHEDTEEINALLYSDDDEDLEEDDEVMSTGHSPDVPKRTHEKLEQFDDFRSCCGPTKRQKIFHGEDMKPMLADNGNAVNLKGLHDYHSDAESNIQEENTNSSAGNEPSKRTEIRETLQILESIIPSAEGKNPLLIIDEAIDYLKSLKHRAMTLGVHYQ